MLETHQPLAVWRRFLIILILTPRKYWERVQEASQEAGEDERAGS